MPPTDAHLRYGSITGLVQLIFIAALALVSVPILITRLGAEAYGVFAVTSLTLTLPIFTSLGLTRSLVKFLSQQGKSPGSNNDIVVAVSLFAGFTLSVMASLFFSRTLVVNTLFGIPPPFQAQAGTLFLLLLGALLPLALGQAANAVIAAMQRVWLSNLLMMIYNALFYGSMIILLMLGYGLVEIGLGILAAALAWMLLSCGFALHHWGSLRTGGLALQFRPLIKKHLGYGLRVYLAEGVAWFVEPVSKILLSNFIGITEAGYFDIAIRVKAQFQGLLTRLLDPFFPYISKVQELRWSSLFGQV